ncbi:MAG: helix-turn-helix domain-containing protein [Terracidiphilus sp.]
MAELWLSCEDLMKVTGWSPRSVQRKAEAGQIKWQNARDRKRNGKPVREYSILSLPADLQVKAAKKISSLRRHKSAQKQDVEQSGNQLSLSFARSPSDFAVMPERVALPNPEDQKQATKRLLHLEPLLSLTSKDSFPATMPDGTVARNCGQAVAWVADQSDQNEKTIRRWVSRYRQGGLPALADKVRRDKNTSRFFTKYPQACWMSAYLFLGNADSIRETQSPIFQGQSVRFIHEQMLLNLDLLEIPEDEAPSYDTVRSWINSLPPSLVTYARMGRKVYRERMSPYLRRAYTDIYANQIWVGDHMIQDVEVSNDVFTAAEMYAPLRIRLTALIDYRSRFFVGESWAWEGSSASLAAAAIRGVTRYGPPEGWYLDNGKDMRKIARGAARASNGQPTLRERWGQEIDFIESSGFIARLGSTITHCIPHHSQSKHIERFFRTLHARFDKAWSTYTSGTPFTRPESTGLAMMRHRRLVKRGQGEQSRHPLASYVIAMFTGWIEEYNNTPHSGQGMDDARRAKSLKPSRIPIRSRRPMKARWRC